MSAHLGRMQRFFPYALAGVMCAGSLSSCSLWHQWIPKKGFVMRTEGKTAEEQIFNGVNQYRKSHDRPALARHAGLDSIARKQARAMAKSGKMDHAHYSARAAEAKLDYGMPLFSENVGHGVSASQLVGLWVASSAHRGSLMGKWRGTGVGTATGADGSLYAIQVFGK
ncbi:MAG: CAP domain-containing protein [Luteolibacter sp.]